MGFENWENAEYASMDRWGPASFSAASSSPHIYELLCGAGREKDCGLGSLENICVCIILVEFLFAMLPFLWYCRTSGFFTGKCDVTCVFVCGGGGGGWGGNVCVCVRGEW